MTRKLLLTAAIASLALTPSIGIGSAHAHGFDGGFHGGGFHGGGFHGCGFGGRGFFRRGFFAPGFFSGYRGFAPYYYGYGNTPFCYYTVYGNPACY